VKNVATVNPNIQGGTPCFSGTRVPVAAFFDYLRDGSTITEFLEDFPTVTREQTDALLAESRESIERAAMVSAPFLSCPLPASSAPDSSNPLHVF